MDHPPDNAVDHKDNEKLVTVARRPTEAGASVLVAVLADEGIRAVATGGFTAGFKAEAPGWVTVQTLESDAERAKTILAELKAEEPPWPDEQSELDEGSER